MAVRSGAPPGLTLFLKEAALLGLEVDKDDWQGKLWESWGRFRREAGFEPGSMTQPLAEDALLEPLAKLTRDKNKRPTLSEIVAAHREVPGFPDKSTFLRRYGSVHTLFDRLRTWTAGRPEYAGVVDVLAQGRRAQWKPPRAALPPDPAQAQPLLSDAFVPPIVDSLPGLASGNPDIERVCAARGLTSSGELERRTAVALQLLGLEVKPLGQRAGGRVADGIVRSRAERWALVYDAKVRRDGYVMGTEDRKFREYL